MWNRISIIVVLLLLAGCTQKTDVVPGAGGEDGPAQGKVVSVAYLKTLYRGYPLVIADNIAVKAIVTANDRYNNFPRTLVVQDSTGGVEIKISGNGLYAGFPEGRTVQVSCRGLTLADYGGMLSLGLESNDPRYENGYIPGDQVDAYIYKYETVQNIEPREVHIATITDSDVGRFVSLRDVQFIDQEYLLKWCEAGMSTDRTITDRQGNRLTVRTNAAASFAHFQLPSGSGYIEGILSVFAGKYQLRVVREKFVVMEEPRF